MKDLRVEVTDDGSALYIGVDLDDRHWAKTTQPDDLITVDWDLQGHVLGVELIGSAASNAIQALLRAIEEYPARDGEGLRRVLDSIIDKEEDPCPS